MRVRWGTVGCTKVGTIPVLLGTSRYFMRLLLLEEGGDWGRANFCRVRASEDPRSSVGLDRIAEDAIPSRRVSYPITLEC